MASFDNLDDPLGDLLIARSREIRDQLAQSEKARLVVTEEEAANLKIAEIEQKPASPSPTRRPGRPSRAAEASDIRLTLRLSALEGALLEVGRQQTSRSEFMRRAMSCYADALLKQGHYDDETHAEVEALLGALTDTQD